MTNADLHSKTLFFAIASSERVQRQPAGRREAPECAHGDRPSAGVPAETAVRAIAPVGAPQLVSGAGRSGDQRHGVRFGVRALAVSDAAFAWS